MSIEERCETIRNTVLDVVVEHFDYFRENKSHLAWALMNFDLIHRASRLAYNACQENANEMYRKTAQRLSQENEALFSDAWDITQMESLDGALYCDFLDFDPNHPVPQNILEYYSWQRESHPGDSSFPTDEELRIKYAFMPCGTPIAELAGYTIATQQVRSDIKEKILALTTDPPIAEAIAKYQEWGEEKVKKEKAQRERFQLYNQVISAFREGRVPPDDLLEKLLKSSE